MLVGLYCLNDSLITLIEGVNMLETTFKKNMDEKSGVTLHFRGGQSIVMVVSQILDTTP